MVNVVLGLSNPFSTAGAAPPGGQSSSLTSQAFESELSQAISDALSKFGIDPSSVQLTVADSGGKNLAASQNSVAETSLATTSPFSQPATAVAAAPAPTPADSTVSADDAYWAKQPEAVRQLRDVQDQGQRTALGEQLAAQGYSIDVPVMVWGWDPGITTQLRESYGYTWVPAALQQPIAAAPGINNPGMASYDPNHPPAGSILV